jgi:hypothetical protein
LTSASSPLVFPNGRSRCPVERGKDRLKAFFDRAASFRVGEHVKLIVANSGKYSPCRIRGVHTATERFGKPRMERVRRIRGCRRSITLGTIARTLPDVGADEPRTQHAHADAEGLQLGGEPFGHGEDGKFACGIGVGAMHQFIMPAIDAVLTMWCPHRARICGRKVSTPLTAPIRFTSRTQRQLPSAIWSMPPPVQSPRVVA